MVRVNNQIELAEVLREFETNGIIFSTDMVSERTSYPKNTISKYFNEKLIGKCIFHSIGRNKYIAEGVLELSNEQFIDVLRQSVKPKSVTPEKRLHDKLIERSLDGFTLALEVYNRPSLKNRVEAFTIMMVNAWELLLKAELLISHGYSTIFYDKERSISLSDALKKRLQENDPVRKNIEKLIELRDQAIHLLIPELQPQLSRLFQATVINYQTRYRNEMGNAPLSGQSVGMLSLVIDGPETEIAVIQKQYGELTAGVVDRFIKSFTASSKECNSNEFSIPVDYRLALVKRKDKSDVSLTVGEEGNKAVIIHKTVDLDVSHPYHTKEAISLINKRQNIAFIKTGAFRAVLHKHKVKVSKKSDLHYDIDGRPRYSQKFIDWFVNSLSQPNWLALSKSSYQEFLKSSRKSKKNIVS